MLAALVRDPLPGWASVIAVWAQTRQRGRPTGQGDALTWQRSPADGGALMGADRCICMLYGV